MAKTKRIEEGGADYPANAPEELKNLESFRYSSKSTQRKMIRDYSKREKTEAKDRAYLETVPEELRGSESFRASSRKEQRKRVKAYEKREKDKPPTIHKRTGGSIRKRTGGSIESYSAQVQRKYGGGKI